MDIFELLMLKYSATKRYMEFKLTSVVYNIFVSGELFVRTLRQSEQPTLIQYFHRKKY